MSDPKHQPTGKLGGLENVNRRVLKYRDGEAPAISVEVLKALFDRIVRDLGISKDRWGRLATAHIYERAREEGHGDKVNLVEERSSLNKNFVTQAKMTWRSFCRGMQFLRARRFRIGVTIEHASGSITEHGLWVVVNPNLTADTELDDDIAVPVEIEFSHPDEGVAGTGTTRLHVPPPDLSRWAGTYPRRPDVGAEGSNSSDPAA